MSTVTTNRCGLLSERLGSGGVGWRWGVVGVVGVREGGGVWCGRTGWAGEG